MSDMEQMAALEWARAHAPRHPDPVEFGRKVAEVFLAAQAVRHHAGDAAATVAALVALSSSVETLQALEQLLSLLPCSAGRTGQARPVDGSGAD